MEEYLFMHELYVLGLVPAVNDSYYPVISYSDLISCGKM